MELLEYQAKKLFSQVGIPVLPSQSIKDSRQLKQLEIPYPVVLKSQVRASGRGRAGGVRFVENTIDAIAAARTIFNLPIQGEYPQVLLAESRYNAMAEFFLAVVLDYELHHPVLLGSTKGGINVEPLLENLQSVVVEDEFSPFYARKLAIKMGLTGKLIQSVSDIIERMYYLFSYKDLDIIEINPLGISAEQKVMALDGKISINDRALKRHPDIISLMELDYSYSNIVQINGLDDKGNIGIICNSNALALATCDLILQHKGKPACCFIINEPNGLGLTDAQQIKEALEEMRQIKQLKIILINIMLSQQASTIVLEDWLDYLQNYLENHTKVKGEERKERPTGYLSRKERKPTANVIKKEFPSVVQLVIRLIGTDSESLKLSLNSTSIHWADNLESAVIKTISLAKIN